MMTFDSAAFLRFLGESWSQDMVVINVTIGEGMETNAIVAACVIGGVLLGGGKANALSRLFLGRLPSR